MSVYWLTSRPQEKQRLRTDNDGILLNIGFKTSAINISVVNNTIFHSSLSLLLHAFIWSSIQRAVDDCNIISIDVFWEWRSCKSNGDRRGPVCNFNDWAGAGGFTWGVGVGLLHLSGQQGCGAERSACLRSQLFCCSLCTTIPLEIKSGISTANQGPS